MKRRELKQIIKMISSSILLLNLNACSTYKSSFNCGDAKGAYCLPMDIVDQMINSGEIERLNEEPKKREAYKMVQNTQDPIVLTQKASENTNDTEVSDVND